MATRLTPLSRILITLLILAGIFFGVKYVLDYTSLGEQIKESAEGTVINRDNTSTKTPDGSSKVSDDEPLIVQVFTWGGYAPGIYFNEGFEASRKSRFYQDYGLMVDFKLIDDFDASRLAWIADEVHLHGNEVSAMVTEMERLGEHDPRVLMQVDWSRGGDAIVGRRGIDNINDLKGKKVAVTPSTPSQSFLIFALESAGLDLSDVNALEVPSAIDAATAFRSGNVDAAVVWSPDDIILTRDIPGARVLQSTVEASHIIADVFVVKQAYADAYPDKLAAFYDGWMRGAAEINSSEANLKKAAQLLADGTGFELEDGIGMIETVRLTTHGDNRNFFGMESGYKGVTGAALYGKMTQTYQDLGFAPQDAPSWRIIRYPRAITSANLTGQGHAAEGLRDFDPASDQDKAKPAISSRPISINFPTGSAVVSENAKSLIDLQFAHVAKAYGNSRIRVEGNTDYTGSRETNIRLSEQRARSVADYLQREYDMDANRFIIVGNGPDKPVPGCETDRSSACLAKNRRTEFQLLAD